MLLPYLGCFSVHQRGIFYVDRLLGIRFILYLPRLLRDIVDSWRWVALALCKFPKYYILLLLSWHSHDNGPFCAVVIANHFETLPVWGPTCHTLRTTHIDTSQATVSSTSLWLSNRFRILLPRAIRHRLFAGLVDTAHRWGYSRFALMANRFGRLNWTSLSSSASWSSSSIS